MKTLGEQDYAAQETMHHLLSLKLHSSSFTVIPVSLNGSRRVQISADERNLSFVVVIPFLVSMLIVHNMIAQALIQPN